MPRERYLEFYVSDKCGALTIETINNIENIE